MMERRINKDQKTIREVISRLNSSDPFARREALDLLSAIGEEAIPGLLVVLRTQPPSVRESAAWSLGEIGSARAVPGLMAALAQEQDPVVRDSIAWALQMIGDSRAVPMLLQAIRSGGEKTCDLYACVIGHLNDIRSVPKLVSMLSENDPTVRQAAAWALAMLGAQMEHEDISLDVVPALASVLDDRDGKVRWVSVRALYEYSAYAAPFLEDAVSALIDRLKDEFESPWGDGMRICDVAARTLEAIDTPRAREALQQWRSG